MESHEACSLFPEMNEVEFKELCENVKKNGVLEPVVVHEGKIIDGRARYKASEVVGCEVRFKKWNNQGGSILEFIASRNLHRRNLTPGQRAAIALDIKDRLNAEYKARMIANLKHGSKLPTASPNQDTGANACQEAAAMLGTNATYVGAVQRIKGASPELFSQIRSGLKTVPQANRELKWAKPLSKKVEEAIVESREPGDDRAQFIEEAIEALRKIKTKCDAIEGLGDVDELVSRTIKALKMAAVECLAHCVN